MLTFAACESLVNVKGGKIDHNTFLIRLDADTYGVRLYATVILRIHRDGTYTLNAGGYRTVTTKDRINNFGPRCVASVKGEWVVWSRGDGSKDKTAPFVDGMRVDDTGRIVS